MVDDYTPRLKDCVKRHLNRCDVTGWLRYKSHSFGPTSFVELHTGWLFPQYLGRISYCAVQDQAILDLLDDDLDTPEITDVLVSALLNDFGADSVLLGTTLERSVLSKK